MLQLLKRPFDEWLSRRGSIFDSANVGWAAVVMLVFAALLIRFHWTPSLLREVDERQADAARYATDKKPGQGSRSDGVDVSNLVSDRLQLSMTVPEELSRLATQFEVSVDAVTYGDPLRLVEGISRAELSVKARGSYTNLRKWLSAIAARFPFLSLDLVSIRRIQPSDSILDANVRFSLYTRSDQQ